MLHFIDLFSDDPVLQAAFGTYMEYRDGQSVKIPMDFGPTLVDMRPIAL